VIVSERQQAREIGPDFGPGLDVLRLAADSGLTELVPRMRFDLTGRTSRVMEVVSGTPAAAHVVAGVLDPAVAAAIGGAVGAWHAGTAGAARRARPAQVSIPAVSLVRDPLLRAALGAARSGWQPTAVVHGDCSSRHASVVDGADEGHPRVVLTSWSRSGAGDPAWDLGCLLADLAAPAPASPGPTVAAGVVAYGRAAGASGDRQRASRAVRCAVARLVAAGIDDRDRRALAGARAIAAAADDWTEAVEGWLR
jgi:hypothetical protein